MRIIGGKYRSLIFKAINWGKYRPMSDRGRMALFNMLGDLSECQLVLDAYAGSGALGFEALSRGAQQVIAIEINNKIYTQLMDNIKSLKLADQIKAYRANNLTLLANLELEYDLIFLDPPYDLIKEESLLKFGQYLKKDGTLVLSCPPHFESPFKAKKWVCLNYKRYANLNLFIYMKK